MTVSIVWQVVPMVIPFFSFSHRYTERNGGINPMTFFNSRIYIEKCTFNVCMLTLFL